MSDERKMITSSDLKEGQSMKMEASNLSADIMLLNVYTYNASPLSDESFNCEMETSNIAGSLSVSPGLSSISEWNSGDRQKRLDFIRDDCLARLKDVRGTNEKARSLSAFMSILALIGMLAKFAFSKNKSLKGKHIDGCGQDQKEYQAFCDCYLLDDSNYEQKLNHKGLSYLLYKYVRCGLLHGGTLTNTRSSTKPVNAKIFLTHSDKSKKSLAEINAAIMQASATNQIEVVLNVFVMCEELEKAIKKMFADTRHEISDSILNTFEAEPPILCINK